MEYQDKTPSEYILHREKYKTALINIHQKVFRFTGNLKSGRRERLVLQAEGS